VAVQDDQRENELRELFELVRDEEEGRSGIDAYLAVGNVRIPFELKSTTASGVTTVRDFGLDHVVKWTGKHWLIGFYDKHGTELQYSLYGSPQQMAPWIEEKREYISTDIMLADLVPEHLSLDDMRRVCGDKQIYSLSDARRIQKQQYKAAEYRAKMDVSDGYSPERMLEIVRDRSRYLILRGSTLNNPHIPGSYFRQWPRITEDHAATLRRMVLEALAGSQ